MPLLPEQIENKYYSMLMIFYITTIRRAEWCSFRHYSLTCIPVQKRPTASFESQLPRTRIYTCFFVIFASPEELNSHLHPRVQWVAIPSRERAAELSPHGAPRTQPCKLGLGMNSCTCHRRVSQLGLSHQSNTALMLLTLLPTASLRQQGRASSTQAPGEHTKAGLLPELTVKNPEGNIAWCIPAALPFTFPLGITWHQPAARCWLGNLGSKHSISVTLPSAALHSKNLCTTEKPEFIIKSHHSKNMKHAQEIPCFQDFRKYSLWEG